MDLLGEIPLYEIYHSEADDLGGPANDHAFIIRGGRIVMYGFAVEEVGAKLELFGGRLQTTRPYDKYLCHQILPRIIICNWD